MCKLFKFFLAIVAFCFMMPIIGSVLEILNIDSGIFMCYALYVLVFSVVLNGNKIVYLCGV